MTNDGIECPFCGSPTVIGTLITTYMFKSEHHLSKYGLNDSEFDSVGDLIGDIMGQPSQKFFGFHCTSCGKEWTNRKYSLQRSENGTYEFVKVEKKKQSGDI